jgi:hypothetical protein
MSAVIATIFFKKILLLNTNYFKIKLTAPRNFRLNNFNSKKNEQFQEAG